MDETAIKELENGLELTIKEYENISVSDDMTKPQACQLVARELKMISDEKKRIFDEKIQNERLQLEKDHKYWSETFEENKQKDESKLSKERLELDKRRQDTSDKLETLRLEMDKTRLDLDKARFEYDMKNRKEEQIFRYVSLGLTILVPFVAEMITLSVFRRLSYSNLKLIYHDEGMPSPQFNDSVRNIQKMIK